MKLSETVQEVIRLAEQIRSYWEEELPKRHPDYPLVHPGDDDGPPPPQERELHDLLKRLPSDTVFALALLADLAHGQVEPDDLAGRYKEVKADLQTRSQAIALLLDTVTLGEDLTDGLAALRENGLDVDALPFKRARSKP
jgi:hypothetical protein